MDPRDSSKKLPVPGAWQPQVVSAMEHLAGRLGVPTASVAVTRVEKAEWRVSADDRRSQPRSQTQSETEASDQANPQTQQGLEIWLIGGGRSYRYRAPTSGVPSPLTDAS